MIENFEVLKSQLEEFAEIVNSFKSESVQLRVVELVFEKYVHQAKPLVEKERPKKPGAVVKKGIKETKQADKGKKSQIKTGRPGPGAIVKRLTDEGFFREKRTVSEIIQHCKANMAFTYKTSELSVGLMRALRNGDLQRDKNENNQFEYYE